MINKVKINPIDRIQRIAMTGDIEDPKPLSPVENIMSHYPKIETQAKEPEEGGFWNGLKNFAGSKGGRMLIGGLGTGLAVGLTGGGLQNALGYGVIGAGKTAENIYNQEQDQKAWEEKEAERLFRQQENLDNRKFQAQMKMAEIEANKQARADELEKIKEELRIKGEYGAFDKKGRTPAEQLKDLATAGATPESLQMFAEANGLNGYKFERPQKLSGKAQTVDLLVEKYGVPLEKAMIVAVGMTPEQELGLYQGKIKADTDGKLIIVDAKHQNAMKLQDDKQAHDVDMVDVKAKADEEKAQRDFKRALAKSNYDNELKKDFEEYKTTLPLPEILKYEQRAKALQKEGFNYTVGDLILEDYLNDVASRDKTNAQTIYTNAQTDFLTGAKTDLTNAQINNVNARTGLTEAQTTKLSKEIENFGKTAAIWAAEWLAEHPNATPEQKAVMGAIGNMSKEVAGFVSLGMPEQDAFNLITGLLQKQLAEANIWTDASSQLTGQVGGTAPVYPAEDGEEIDASSLF